MEGGKNKENGKNKDTEWPGRHLLQRPEGAGRSQDTSPQTLLQLRD